MGAEFFRSRNVVGNLIKTIGESTVPSWVGATSYLNDNATQEYETYGHLQQVANMTEWKGERKAKRLREESFVIQSKEYEDTLIVTRRNRNNDQTGQVQQKISSIASESVRHWAQLLSPLIVNGSSSVSTYGANATADGLNYFGTHRNSLSNIVAVSKAGSRITPAEMVTGILQCLERMMSFTDEQNQPANEGMSQVLIKCGTALMGPMATAVSQLAVQDTSGTVVPNVLPNVPVNISFEVNTRLDASFTDASFAMFRTDDAYSPLIRQEEEGVVVEAVAEGSEYEFNTGNHKYGVRATRGVGYGMWEHAIRANIS